MSRLLSSELSHWLVTPPLLTVVLHISYVVSDTDAGSTGSRQHPCPAQAPQSSAQAAPTKHSMLELSIKENQMQRRQTV